MEKTEMALDVDKQAVIQSLARAFRENGAELYLVGGAVRDNLLGRAGYELDFATSARPADTARIIQDRGMAHPYRIGEKFGTIGAHIGPYTVEITTYRSDTYQPGSRKPEVEFGASLEADLARRDFTINAIALDPTSGDLIDLFGGLRDLQAGLVRAVGRPLERFREDPLRLLRAVRFAQRLDFDVDPETWVAMTKAAPSLGSISRERVRDEYTKLLEDSDPVRGLTLLRDSGLLATSVPQLVELTRMPDHGPRHPLSLWDHTMRVAAAVPPLLSLRWAALLHDIAKPATRTHEPSGRPRFFHHEEVGSQMARDILGGLRYSNSVVDAVALLVSTHMQLHTYNHEWSEGAVRRLMLRLGPLTDEAITLARADAAGHALSGPGANSPKFDELQARVRQLSEEPVEALDSPLTGDDLMARYARPPGPWIRRIKDALREEVLEGRLGPDDRERAFELADELVGVE